MRHWGYLDAVVTPTGRDAGIDIRSSRALGQVKFEAAQVGTPVLQRLVGARALDHEKELFFFSGAGYARPAIDYADTMRIALFKYQLDGRMVPQNEIAQTVVERAREREVEAHAAHRQAAHEAAPQDSAATALPMGELPRGGCLLAIAGALTIIFALVALITAYNFVTGADGTGEHWWEPLVWGGLAVVCWSLWMAVRRFREPTSPLEHRSVAMLLEDGDKTGALAAYCALHPLVMPSKAERLIEKASKEVRTRDH